MHLLCGPVMEGHIQGAVIAQAVFHSFDTYGFVIADDQRRGSKPPLPPCFSTPHIVVFQIAGDWVYKDLLPTRLEIAGDPCVAPPKFC